MDRQNRRESARALAETIKSGLGVPCGEAQADGVPCGELGVLCSECERACAVERNDPPERVPAVRRIP